jgi:hypothetical protein
MKTRSRRSDEVLTFGVMLACSGAVTAALSLQMMIGFAIGVIVTLGAAVIAGASLDDFE